MFARKFVVVALVLLAPWQAVVASETPGPLEEVVVSGFRREAPADLDASISLLDRKAIETASLQNFEELIPLIPNMNFSGDGSRARYFQMRGVGELEQYEGAPNPSIGFIVDDIDLSGVAGISSTFDLQQVEVLRGPQATRFGASALAGLVYVQSADPGPETAGNAEATLGSDATRAWGVAAGGGLAEGLSGRASLHSYRSNGFYRNQALGVDDSNGRDETTARGKLMWQLAGGWIAKLSALYADFDNGYDAWSPENGRVTYSDHPGRDEQKTAGASLKVSGPLGATAELTSITGGAYSDVLFSFDGEWGDAAYWAPYVYDYVYSDQRKRKSFTQELRLVSLPEGRLFGGRSDWVLGLYLQKLDESDAILSAGVYDDSADAPYSYCTPCEDYSTLHSDFQSTNYAVFGRLDSALSQRLSLKAGARLERWEADYSDAFADYIYGDPANPVRHQFRPRENLWGGDLGLEFFLSDAATLYARLARGYKGGGFNPSLARALGPDAELGPEAIAYDPETILNWEAGLKGVWKDGRLTADLSVFYMDRKDMQLRSSVQFTDNPNDFVFVTSNAQGHSQGLEANFAWQATERWLLHGGLGLLDTEIDEYVLKREADIAGEIVGRAFAHAPRYTLNLGATWSPADGWLARLDLYAADAFYFDYSHDERSRAYRTVNLKLGRQWRRWSVFAWVRNLLDEEYYTRGFSFGLEPPLFERKRYTRLGDPRHYGLTVTYRY